MDSFEARWEEFENECKECNDCDLASTRKNVVIYRGSKRAPLMIIGEAPGHDEDEKGQPFVGRSGKLLQFMIGASGLADGDYHICNICKCRPPENRRPTSNEISCCKRHLGAQFNLVQPRFIILCGSTAYEAFFNAKPVMRDVRGKFVVKNGYEIMTTYHPAFALRNPKNKIPMMEDISLVVKRMEELGLIDPIEKINGRDY